MQIIEFKNIREELISNLRRNMVIPVIGSGFTKGCKSYRGTVPSGESYKNYMAEQIQMMLNLSESQYEEFARDSFANISSVYQRAVPIDSQKNYLRDHFSRVTIEEEKRRFLTISWPYIYTLNIDDGIEKNSKFCHVVYANRTVNEDIFNQEDCVIKLHGDISEMLTYDDSNSAVFTQEQYISSLKSNTSLLKKLKHDMLFQNILFVGCSLSNEIDLLETASSDCGNMTARYYCTTSVPNQLEIIKLERYGITHCVIFDSYAGLYDEIYDASVEADKVRVNDLDAYKSFTIRKLSSSYEENKSYLLYGKSLVGKDRVITLPYFFISRERTDFIYKNISKYPIQFVIGSGCSGRSYILADLAIRIRDKDVFLFETKDRISSDAFENILDKHNCIILADDGALTIYQIETLIKRRKLLDINGVRVVIFACKNDRDLAGLIKLCEIRGDIKASDILQVELNNRFTQRELNILNPLLTAVGAGVFSRSKSIVDNIIEMSNNLLEKNKYYNKQPRVSSKKELASLISLATEKKLYSSRLIELDIVAETELQRKTSEPLIDNESTWSFEKNAGDNSPIKYVVNAEYWLHKQLAEYANRSNNHLAVADAYKYIVDKIIECEGAPQLAYSNKDASYKDYMLFDNINKIFYSGKSGGLELIKLIYEKLNDSLSVDPHYMHQRAKCYIKIAYSCSDISSKLANLDKAYRDANVAAQVFEQRFDQCHNDKIMISLAHVTYTKALILCHRAKTNEYCDKNENTDAIKMLYDALKSPYNSYDFAKKDTFNMENAIAKMVTHAISQKRTVNADVYTLLEELFRIINSNSQE